MHVSIYKNNTYKGKKLLKSIKRKPLRHVQNKKTHKSCSFPLRIISKDVFKFTLFSSNHEWMELSAFRDCKF